MKKDLGWVNRTHQLTVVEFEALLNEIQDTNERITSLLEDVSDSVGELKSLANKKIMK